MIIAIDPIASTIPDSNQALIIQKNQPIFLKATGYYMDVNTGIEPGKLYYQSSDDSPCAPV